MYFSTWTPPYLTPALSDFLQVFVEVFETMFAAVCHSSLRKVTAVNGIHGWVLVSNNLSHIKSQLACIWQNLIKHVCFCSTSGAFPIVSKSMLCAMLKESNLPRFIIMESGWVVGVVTSGEVVPIIWWSPVISITSLLDKVPNLIAGPLSNWRNSFTKPTDDYCHCLFEHGGKPIMLPMHWYSAYSYPFIINEIAE